jgi:hypothetical protein
MIVYLLIVLIRLISKGLALSIFNWKSARNEAVLKTWETRLKLKEKDFLLNLYRKPMGFGHLQDSVDLYESTKLWVTIFYKYLALYIDDPSLLPRNTNVTNGNIIIDPSADIEVGLYTENNNVDGFGKAFNVWLEHHVLFVLRLLKVEEISFFASISTCTNVVQFESIFAQLTPQFLPIVRVYTLEFLWHSLGI